MIKKYCFIFVLFSFFHYALALESSFLEKLTLQAKAQKVSVDKIEIAFQGIIQPSWYIYTSKKKTNSPLQTKIKFQNTNWQNISLVESPPKLTYDELAKDLLLVHKNIFTITTIALWQPKNNKEKLPKSVVLDFIFQICNQKICSLPQKIVLDIPISTELRKKTD